MSSKNCYCPLDFSLALSGSLCVHSEVSFRMSNPTHLLSDSLLSFFSSVNHHSLYLFTVLFSFSFLRCLFLSSCPLCSSFLFPFSLHPSAVCPFSFPEQPVDHSLPISWFLTDQQLCVQLPAPVAPQSNHKPGKRRLPPMVRCMQS